MVWTEDRLHIVIMEVDIVHYCFMLNESSAELLRMMVMMKAGR